MMTSIKMSMFLEALTVWTWTNVRYTPLKKINGKP